MLPGTKSKTNIGILVGMAVILVGIIAKIPHTDWIFNLIGTVFFIWGCSWYAKGKGYHGAMGFLGLLNILGLIILACIPDKHKEGR